MYCKKCGSTILDNARFCAVCGAEQNLMPVIQNQAKQPMPPVLVCPKCGSGNIQTQLFRDDMGSRTVTKSKTHGSKGGHGIIWWLFIGWWWWIIDLFIWIIAFIPRLLIQIFKKKQYRETTQTVTSTSNNIIYRSMCLCPRCGYHWEC